jgi:2-methylcitrate dehydratase PrpD
MAHDIAKRLAEFTVRTKSEDIPADVLQFCKILTLKTMGGMIAGSAHPSAQKMARLVRERRQEERCGVIHGGFRTSLWDAVLLNSFFAHAREMEDDRFGGGVSWDITVIPTLISLGEKLKLSGKALLEAIAVGLEVHARTCLFGAEHLGLTIVPGAVGPAAGAARALGLNEEQTAAAMGLALSSANLSLTNFGTDAHYLESSLHSLQAIIAAEMAQQNMTSNPDLGAYLTRLLGKEVEPEALVRDLGKHWHLTEIMIKKYSCCFILHRQIDSVLQLRREHRLSFEDVAEIEVHGSPADQLCNRPEPKTEGDLQFSFQHTLGTAMYFGELGLDHFSTRLIDEPRFVAARSKVKVSIDPALPKIIMQAPSRVTIRTKDGRAVTQERMYPIGSLQEPLSVDGIRDVYRMCVKGLIAEKDLNASADAILALEKQPGIGELIEMLM